MTRRHDLELAVIEAARAVDDAWYKNLNINPAAHILHRAVDELDKLREVEKPRAPAVAPVTSHEAAAWAAKTQKAVNRRILYYTWRWASSGVTTDDLIHALDSTHQTVSARVNELVNAGWLVDTGRVWPTRSGANATLWKLSPAARDVMRNVWIDDWHVYA